MEKNHESDHVDCWYCVDRCGSYCGGGEYCKNAGEPSRILWSDVRGNRGGRIPRRGGIDRIFVFNVKNKKGDKKMGLLKWIEEEISNGEYDDEEDFCNQNGCNYEDIYDDFDDSDDHFGW